MAPDAPDFSSMRRALVVKLRHHGDVLLSSPVFTALKAHAPHLALDALVYDDTREMISLHPAIDQIHCVDRQWRTLPALTHGRAEWALWQRLRDARYDLLIHLTDHPRGAWLARTLGTRVSVAPRRQGRAARGVGGRWWRSSFTHHYPVIGSGRRHTVETHLDALRRIGFVWPCFLRLRTAWSMEVMTVIPSICADILLVPAPPTHSCTLASSNSRRVRSSDASSLGG